MDFPLPRQHEPKSYLTVKPLWDAVWTNERCAVQSHDKSETNQSARRPLYSSTLNGLIIKSVSIKRKLKPLFLVLTFWQLQFAKYIFPNKISGN